MFINKTIVTSILAAGLLVGCASGPDRTASDFGNSVRLMQHAQTLDPVAAQNPDMTPVDGTDGQRMENAIEAYREGVSGREKTDEPITISIGGANGAN